MRTETDSTRSVIYAFEDFRVDPAKRLVLDKNGDTLPLMPKAVEILLYLIKNAGQVVEKDELMSEIWPDTIVEENNLTQNISALRRALGEKHRENRFIATVPGRGYKFVADVREIKAPDAGKENRIEPADPKMGISRSVGRKWLIGLALVVLIGVAWAGFILYRENSANPSGAIRSIAVLPFKPITAASRDEALEMGMADTLILKLSGGEHLTVRPLAAVRRFASPDQDAMDAGRVLGVEAVLDGGVQISGGRVRISAKLIRTSDGQQLWSGQFDEPLGDIFAVQDSISQRVAAALRISLADNSGKTQTPNVEAYQLYLRGRLHASRLVLPELQKGISFYEQAIAVDPAYAIAYADLANAYRAMVLTNDAPPAEIMPKAKGAAVKAVQLDPNLADAWTSLASSEFWHDWDWQAAEGHFKRALELDSSSAPAHVFYAHLLSNLGRHDEAIREMSLARQSDPLSLFVNVIEGQILSIAGRDDESLRMLQTTIDLDPDFWLAHLFIARTYMNKGMLNEAIASAALAKDITNGNSEATGTVGYLLAKTGRTVEARTVLKELEDRAKTRFVPAYALAQVHLGLGNRAAALDHLEKAFDQREALMVFLKVERRWNEIRSEPRFIDLIKLMNFE